MLAGRSLCDHDTSILAKSVIDAIFKFTGGRTSFLLILFRTKSLFFHGLIRAIIWERLFCFVK